MAEEHEEGLARVDALMAKLVERCSDRMYSKQADEKRSCFAVLDAVCFLHSLQELYIVPHDNGAIREARDLEPVFSWTLRER